jgi:hypothetical protein
MTPTYLVRINSCAEMEAEIRNSWFSTCSTCGPFSRSGRDETIRLGQQNVKCSQDKQG